MRGIASSTAGRRDFRRRLLGGFVRLARGAVDDLFAALDRLHVGVLSGDLLLLPAGGFGAVLDAGKLVYDFAIRECWDLFSRAPRQQ